MADELLLEIVTPERMAFRGKVEEVTVPGTEGEFGVLRGHAPLLSTLQIGEMSFLQDKKRIFYAVNTGFAEVVPDRVTILVETAERADTIDRERAKQAKERAEARLAKLSREEERDFLQARAALLRAVTRLNVADKA